MILRASSVGAVIGVAAGLWLATAVLFFPWLLLFPHHRMVGETPVYAAAPITPGMEGIIRRADARLRTSPLYRSEVSRHPVYLTDGGIRWSILAVGSDKASALTRGFLDGVVINRSSIEEDFIWRKRSASRRTLSGAIAHEKTHKLIHARFGTSASVTYPRWLLEGYCDHVAGESSLTDDQATRMLAAGQTSNTLFYYQARKRVAAALAANGGSVDALFEAAQRP